jgi:group I intron endonuclease
MAIIYTVTNVVTGKKYVGFTINALKKRKYQHKQKAKHNSPFVFHKSIRKHGWDNFKWEVIYESWDVEHCLTIMEPFFIQEHNTLVPNGYNSCVGGRKGMLGIKREPLTKEQRHNISVGTKRNALSGKNHPMYGTKANEKFLQAAKTSMVGKNHSVDTKKKQSESRKEYLKDNKVGMFGKKHNDETKQKMKLKRMNKWALYDPQTKQTTLIDDLMEYSRINKIKYKTVYSWKYKSVDGKQMLTKVK